MSNLSVVVAVGSLAVGMLTGVVVAVAYLHRTFALRSDLTTLADRFEDDMVYVRGRLDTIVDRVSK